MGNEVNTVLKPVKKRDGRQKYAHTCTRIIYTRIHACRHIEHTHRAYTHIIIVLVFMLSLEPDHIANGQTNGLTQSLIKLRVRS